MEERGEITQGLLSPPVDLGRMQHTVTGERVVMRTGHEERERGAIAAKSLAAATPGKGSEIMLRFQVDPQTRQVTIFVLDKTHRNVIRTIPPEEMARLKIGEIIDLFV